jgi:hypothetical protein
LLTPKPKTLHAKTEASLASFQVSQVGNTCTFHVISAGLKILLNFKIDPDALSEQVNRLWWRGRFMRVFPNWAVTPRMQVRIVRYLAKKHNLPISATFQHGNPESLPEILSHLNVVPIVTIIWPWRKAPQIFLGGTNRNFNATRSAGAHSMLFAAYNPNHTTDGNVFTPWGFINPWIDNAQQLFWMTDEDFQRAWRFWLPGIGQNPLVLIRRENVLPAITTEHTRK